MFLQKPIVIGALALPTPFASAVLGDYQNWDSAAFGQRGTTICPEPGMQNGTTVKTSVCQVIKTSEGVPTCYRMPIWANVSLPRPSVFYLM